MPESVSVPVGLLRDVAACLEGSASQPRLEAARTYVAHLLEFPECSLCKERSPLLVREVELRCESCGGRDLYPRSYLDREAEGLITAQCTTCGSPESAPTLHRRVEPVRTLARRRCDCGAYLEPGEDFCSVSCREECRRADAAEEAP